MSIRAVFMGSPEFAVPCLHALKEHPGIDVVAVVSQPDKPAGRGLAMVPPAVKLAALEMGLPVWQDASIRTPEFLQKLKELAPKLIVVVAYGKILPRPVLEIPEHGCWNIHASLLPRYRGAAPIQWALIRGEHTTGVTLMQMDQGMDTGPMLLSKPLQIRSDDTAGSLSQRLSSLGAELLSEGLELLFQKKLPPPQPQDGAAATLAPLLDKENGRINFNLEAELVSGQIRGVDPWPGAFTTLTLDGAEVPLKLFTPQVLQDTGPPGTVLRIDRHGMRVACKGGAVSIAELQLPSRKRLAAALLGRYIKPGMVLGADHGP